MDWIRCSQLHAEKSQNISTGITLDQVLIFCFDFYHIKVKDRVLFSGEVGLIDDTTTNPVEQVLLQ
jgi:iron complex outermembrane receptor protein